MASAVAVHAKGLQFVVMRQVTLDGGFERSDVLEGPASDALCRDLRKERGKTLRVP
jgi:hypothetical protein